jgi:hypothetical protein
MENPIYYLDPNNSDTNRRAMNQQFANDIQDVILDNIRNSGITLAGISGQADSGNPDASVETVSGHLRGYVYLLPYPQD